MKKRFNWKIAVMAIALVLSAVFIVDQTYAWVMYNARIARLMPLKGALVSARFSEFDYLFEDDSSDPNNYNKVPPLWLCEWDVAASAKQSELSNDMGSVDLTAPFWAEAVNTEFTKWRFGEEPQPVDKIALADFVNGMDYIGDRDDYNAGVESVILARLVVRNNSDIPAYLRFRFENEPDAGADPGTEPDFKAAYSIIINKLYDNDDADETNDTSITDAGPVGNSPFAILQYAEDKLTTHGAIDINCDANHVHETPPPDLDDGDGKGWFYCKTPLLPHENSSRSDDEYVIWICAYILENNSADGEIDFGKPVVEMIQADYDAIFYQPGWRDIAIRDAANSTNGAIQFDTATGEPLYCSEP